MFKCFTLIVRCECVTTHIVRENGILMSFTSAEHYEHKQKHHSMHFEGKNDIHQNNEFYFIQASLFILFDFQRL